VELVPCAALDAGLLRSAGENVALPVVELRPWVAGGVAVRLAWQTAPRWVTEATASLLVPFDAYRFDVVGPGSPARTEVHEMAPVAAAFAVGFAYDPW
jgi:hypothetical protein